MTLRHVALGLVLVGLLIVSGTLNVTLGTDTDPGEWFQCSFSIGERETP